MPTSQHKDPVVEGRHIGNTHDEMATHLQGTRNLVPDPEDLLHVFKDLICNYQVQTFIRSRQALLLQVALERLHANRAQPRDIVCIELDGELPRMSKALRHNSEITPAAGADIKHCFHSMKPGQEFLYYMGSVLLLDIGELRKDALTTLRTRHYVCHSSAPPTT